ncbi:uncharacterized protein [Centruroides vittatus]|uniref:uncharacterized protein n=1 Tax=Centruroides vittatus TaxID=120091 RepID=UPI00351038A9
MAQKKGAGNIIINKAQDLHIGNRYYWNQVNNVIRNFNEERDERDGGSADEEVLISLPEELINSERMLEIDDFYLVAEKISDSWKKLARFLPPKNVFTEAQLSTLQTDNNGNLEETIIQMLQLWKEQHPEFITVSNLAITLQSIGRADIAKELHP